MTELIAITYVGHGRAAEVLDALKRLHCERLVELNDACIVTRDAAGSVELHQSLTAALPRTSSGSRWSHLIGGFMLVPLVGLVVGYATGRLNDSMLDHGINRDFLRAISGHVSPGTSALFIMMRRAVPRKFIAELRLHGGSVQHTSVSVETEQRILGTLSGAAQTSR
jgi:uncharacterized membrane protein